MIMKKKYMKPSVQVVLLQHRITLLAGSVIGPDEPNKPAGARAFVDVDDWDDWE